MCAQEDKIHLKLCFMQSWALLNHYSSLLDTLGLFWGSFGPFWDPFVMKSPFEKFQHFYIHVSRRGQKNYYSSLLDTLGPPWTLFAIFWGILGLLACFGIFLGPFVIKSPFEQFKHFLHSH
jgi:uncharacterized Tic20 family protein